MDLRGPCKYVRREAAFKNIKDITIADACIDISGVVTPLQENCFYLERKTSTFFVYHHFAYYDNFGALHYGHWSDRNMPLDTFKKIKKVLFRHKIFDYYDEETGQTATAIFRIIFTEKAAAELKGIN
jgi:hypothetical protein